MPKYISTRDRAKAEKLDAEQALRHSLQAESDLEQLISRAGELQALLSEKVVNLSTTPEDSFLCAWHPPGAREFTGRGRIVYEISARYICGDDGEEQNGRSFRDRPMYFTCCLACELEKQLVDHLTE